jgi:pimeloyl-ACP methyl ester carboxylesterase
MPATAVNGIDLYFGDYGSGTPIVLAHGVGGNHASWFHQIAYFSSSYRVIAIDHRGFGNSDDTNGLGAASFADDLGALLDDLNIQQTVLVAQSMGGGTCLGFALRHPERTLALVMADTLGGISAPGRLQERLEEQRGLTDNLSQADRVVSKRFQESQPALTQLYLEIASFNATNRRNLRGRPIATPSSDDLARLAMPKLFIVGSEDVLVPPDIVRLGASLVPEANVVVISGAGHSAYFEKPEAFNQIVYDFLSRAGLGASGSDRASAIPVGAS